ncbi:WcbI family polysaccharide biosynthesis putative acetyltransferase [Alteromonas lipolytica]|uniref:Polysaccharide biosynthesis enzyme WcbI domain-containing protein n=1 Tax=Alteromonas lipolytica TaxID=1856405 RepID=A0A1E8FFB0_9ALTE|nr:WcbI family polysaccharide biosynthesis putative acetyltransferase [Alteromonas lipolytica]OFI34446.1 hypothetical protein BFC17_17570 [Alteromonas lipolytica]GGF84581.1 capsular polysaccharide biosynthesis protein [Alteromonas lipolytica]
MSKIKISIIGNCQNFDIANILSICTQNRNTIHNFNHNSLSKNSKEVEDTLSSSDYIITQHLSESFGDFSTQSLKSRFHSKCVVIPNLFFRGYHPELTYAGQEGQRAQSPLGDYHHIGIVAGHQLNIAPSNLIRLLKSNDFYTKTGLESVYFQSLNELRSRELNCDVTISDYIEKNFRSSALFYTVNHPTILLLAELVTRILVYIGLPFVTLPQHVVRSPMLQGPIFAISKEYSLLNNITVSQPFFIKAANAGGDFMSLENYIAASYNLYSGLALTPRFREDFDKVISYFSDKI